MENGPGAGRYPLMFRQYIYRSTAYMLEEVAKAEVALSIETCEQALHTLNYGLKLDEAWPVTRDLLCQMAPMMEQLGYRNSWISYLVRGIQQGQNLVDLAAEAEFNYHLGILYRLMGQFDEANQRLELSLAQHRSLGEDVKVASVLAQQAFLLRLERRFEEASALVENALNLLPTQEGVEHAYAYLVQSAIALDQGAWDEAQRYIQKSIGLWENRDEKRMLAWGFGNLGLILRNKKQYAEALTCYQRTIALFEHFNDPAGKALARMNLGTIYLSLGSPQKALAQYQSAEPVFQDTHDKLHLNMCHMNQGISYRMMENWLVAKTVLSKSAQQWEEMNNIHFLLNTLDELAQAYMGQRLYQSAIDALMDARKHLSNIDEESMYKQWSHKLTTRLDQCQKLKKAGYLQ